MAADSGREWAGISPRPAVSGRRPRGGSRAGRPRHPAALDGRALACPPSGARSAARLRRPSRSPPRWPSTTDPPPRHAPASAPCPRDDRLAERPLGSRADSSRSCTVLATAVVVLFQLGVAAGKAWGEYTHGRPLFGRAAGRSAAGRGTHPAWPCGSAGGGRGPTRPGLVGLGWQWQDKAWLPFVPVVVAALSLVLNASSRSEPECRTWTPVAIVLLVSSLAVAILTR